MPSSKSIDRSNEYSQSMPSLPAPAYFEPKTHTQRNVVSFDQWFEQNHDHLADVYHTLQEACQTTGRLVFDRDTCCFMKFCEVAYKHSYKYQKNDENYEPDYDEAEDNTVVFT